MDLLKVVFTLFVLDSEEERAGPARAGDSACDLGKTLIPGALIFIALRFDIHEVNLIAPLTHQSRSGSETRAGRNCAVRVDFKGSRHLTKAASTRCAQ